MTSFLKNRMKDYYAAGISIRPSGFGPEIRQKLEVMEKTDVASRIFRKDPTVWVPDRTKAGSTPELVDRLGWLAIPAEMKSKLRELNIFAAEIKDRGYKHVVLLGMGGSSLAPGVFADTFGNEKGYPVLKVLDSTHPYAIKKIEGEIDMARTLFIVSSKSGTTLETSSLYKYFYGRTQEILDDPGKNFIAITDPGTALEVEAREKHFGRIFLSPPDVGGRYSALTYFGLVPAALIGVNLDRLMENAMGMVEASRISAPSSENPALVLGTVLGMLANSGKNKLTLFLSDRIASLGTWIEQLIAESTGKNNKGILPVVDEPFIGKDFYSKDRVFVFTAVKGDDDEEMEARIDALESAGHPVILIEIEDIYGIGAEFFRWEMACAVAGSELGINPFDQPDVESTKIQTRKLMKLFEKEGSIKKDPPCFSQDWLEIRSMKKYAGSSARDILEAFLAQYSKNDYVAFMAYLPERPETTKIFSKIRNSLLKRSKIPTTFGYGPRFLHSTGQLHKGDSNGGLFVQVTGECGDACRIPGTKYDFENLIDMQAQGDLNALLEKGRRVIGLHVKGEMEEGLEKLYAMFT